MKPAKPFWFILSIVLLNWYNLSAQDEWPTYYSKDRFRVVPGYQFNFESHAPSVDFEFSAINPLETVEYFDTRKQKTKSKLLYKSFGLSFLRVGGEFHTNTGNVALRFAVAECISKVSITAFQFVWNMGPEYRGWAYRPELGVGFWIFQVNYGFNLYFNKDLKEYGQHVISFRTRLPY